MAILSKGTGKNIHQATADDEFCSKKPLVLLSTNYRTLGTDLLLLKVYIPSSVLLGTECSERAELLGIHWQLRLSEKHSCIQ